jgi:uncharacterized protein
MHMNEIVATAFWRRLDTEGHDGCRLIRMKDGWRLSGSAIFDHQGKACMLDYAVDCDAAWRTLSARVHGSVGLDELAFDIERTPDGDWLLNGKVQPAAKGCIDLDLGFTPATNLIAIRRLDPGEEVETPAPRTTWSSRCSSASWSRPTAAPERTSFTTAHRHMDTTKR